MQAWEMALELREETRKFWESEVGQRFSQHWSDSRAVHSSVRRSQEVGMSERIKLSVAAPFYVTKEMVDLVEHAAKTFPVTPLHQSDLMVDTGFVVFGRSIPTIDLQLKPLPWRAFAWGLAQDARTLENAVGIHLTVYAHKDDDPQRAAEDFGMDYFTTLSLTHETGWTFGTDYTGRENWKPGMAHNEDIEIPDEALESGQHMMKVMHSFFLLSQQRIGQTDSMQVSRGTRRRYQRDTNRPIPDVRVVTLRRRRQRIEAGEHMGGGREYSHRWWVNGHWRRQWYESEGRHKPKFIEGYVKGPDHLPFQPKDTTYLWRR